MTEEKPKMSAFELIAEFKRKLQDMRTLDQLEGADLANAIELLELSRRTAYVAESHYRWGRQKHARFKRIYETRKAELEAQGAKPDIFGQIGSDDPIMAECLQESCG